MFSGGNPFGGGGGGGGGADRGRLRLVLGHPVGHLQHRRRARRARSRSSERGKDLETTVTLSFEQAIEGAQVPVVGRHARGRARPAAARGARPGTSPKVCPVCNGRGVEAQGQGVFSITRPCSRCNGSGTVIEEPCPTCAGEGRLREVKRYRVNIPAGVREGSRIQLAGKGEAGLRGGPPGDLYVVTHVTESPVFKPKGDNYEVEVPITVAEALGGAEVEVPTLQRHQEAARRAGHQARHGPAPARRGAAEARPVPAGATCTIAS